jgi:hypothetical protein
MMASKKVTLSGAAVAVLAAANTSSTDLAHCYGVNACKGDNDCKTASNACGDIGGKVGT